MAYFFASLSCIIFYSSDKLLKLAEVDRLQAAVGPRRVRRRGHALRALAAHLAPGHRPLQQVSYWRLAEKTGWAIWSKTTFCCRCNKSCALVQEIYTVAELII